MRVLAARFPDRRLASAVRDLLQHRLHPRPRELDIAPLGLLTQPADEPADDCMVLAGRFLDEQAREVADLVREAGGEIVANVDEAWTRPRILQRRPSADRPKTTFVFKRNGLNA
jgi:hypothetical protein